MNKTAIVDHVKRHQFAYGFGAGIAITGITCIIIRSSGVRGAPINTASLIFRNNQTINMITTQLIRRGHPGKIIQCKETGEIFASISRGANLMGINRSNLSSHLSGRIPHVGGHTFEILGEAI